MKKLLVLLLLGALLFLFSCGGGDITTTSTTASGGESQLPTRICFIQYSEYEAFLQQNAGGFSEHFIPYQKLSVLGDFSVFVCEAEHSVLKKFSGSFQEVYKYVFKRKWEDWEYMSASESDTFFATSLLSPSPGFHPDFRRVCSLFISYEVPLDKGGTLSQNSPSRQDLRTFGIADCCYEKNGMWYSYTDGVLSAITWQNGSYWFSLKPNDEFLKWDLREDMLFADFLKADTCQQAKETLMASIFGTE